MHNNVSTLSELEITAYHEAGHTVAAQIVGKRIGTICIILSHTEQTQILGGEAKHDPGTSIDTKWVSLDLDRYIPYEKLPPPSPDDEYKNDRDNCAITCAGWVAEELLCNHLRREESTVQSDENNRDIKKARELMQRFPLDEQEKELLNAEARARHILSNPKCWSMVENLANKLIDDILQGQKQKQQVGPTDWCVFTPDELHTSFARTLNLGKT